MAKLFGVFNAGFFAWENVEIFETIIRKYTRRR